MFFSIKMESRFRTSSRTSSYVNAFGNSEFRKTDILKYQEISDKMKESNQLLLDAMVDQNNKLNLYISTIIENNNKINQQDVKISQIDDIWIKLKEQEIKVNTLIDLMKNLNHQVKQYENIFYKINEILRRWHKPLLHSIRNLRNIFTTLTQNNIIRRIDFFESDTDIPYLQNEENFNIMKNYVS